MSFFYNKSWYHEKFEDFFDQIEKIMIRHICTMYTVHCTTIRVEVKRGKFLKYRIVGNNPIWKVLIGQNNKDKKLFLTNEKLGL